MENLLSIVHHTTRKHQVQILSTKFLLEVLTLTVSANRTSTVKADLDLKPRLRQEMVRFPAPKAIELPIAIAGMNRKLAGAVKIALLLVHPGPIPSPERERKQARSLLI